MKSNYLPVIDGKKYYFDFDKISEICFISKKEQIVDTKITDVSSIGSDDDEGFVAQKVIEENKYNDTQNDILMQDIVKTFIIRLLEAPLDMESFDFATSLAFNTCLKSEIIKEIKE